MPIATRRRVLDLGVPGALIALGLAEVFVAYLGSDLRGGHAENAAFMVACCAPLAWRRRAPLLVVLAWLVATAAYTIALYTSTQPPIEPFLAGLVAFFALGDTGGARQLRAGIGLLVLMALESVVELALGHDPGNVLPPLAWWAAALGAGRFVRSRRHLLDVAGDRAARPEREREEARERAVVEERARIARELHDVIAHSVSVMVVQASAERRVLAPELATTQAVLASIETAGRDALAELRRLLGVLRAPDNRDRLAPQPGLAALDELVASGRQAGHEIRVDVSGDVVELSPGVDLAAYRIVQEALTNIRKHAAGAGADVTLRYGARELGIEVVDDGPGPNGTGTQNGGHGLVGMRERVALYGGSVEFGPGRAGTGFRVRARLPLRERGG
jgi:signal transduction histidine kinase